MRVGDRWHRTIAAAADGRAVEIIDQTALPERLELARLTTVVAIADAIRTMRVRGAPLIGIAAAFGAALALRADPSDQSLDRAIALLSSTRPTAVNLQWALAAVRAVVAPLAEADRADAAWSEAIRLAEGDVAVCRAIGEHGQRVIEERWHWIGRSRPVSILTHCNAGWLATVDWGTAMAPIYRAHEAGIPVHVWVDETRPRNQGLLTAWELAGAGVPHTVIVDNAGGHLMRQGRIDLCLVGTDRVAANGDTANKIGTYLKALAAFDNGIPFQVAAPSSSIDWSMPSGASIPIEERAAAELGLGPGIPAANPAFDVTPARLISGFVTERGLAPATAAGLARLFPERSR